MHKLTSLLLLLVPLLTIGQTKTSLKVLLNEQEISFDSVFIYPKNIASILVNRDSATQEILIKTKDDTWRYQSIDQLIRNNSNHPEYSTLYLDKTIKTVYFINNKLINNRLDVKIDISYFADVSIFSLQKVKSLDNLCNNIVIISIKLTEKRPEIEIYIRGDSQDEILNYYKRKK